MGEARVGANREAVVTGNRESTREELRRRVQERLARKRQGVPVGPPQPPPRYDDVYFEGVKWLDSLAYEPEEEHDDV